MFQDTSYTSPEWLLAIYIPPISVARLPFLHVLSCISGFDTLFSMALLTDGKRDFFVALICLSRLLGWPKTAYAFFPEYIQEKTHTPLLANQATWKGKSALQRSLASQRANGPCGKKCPNQENCNAHSRQRDNTPNI